MDRLIRGGFKGGQNQGGARDPPVLPTPLIDHQGGAGDPPVVFDIFDSVFFITYTNYMCIHLLKIKLTKSLLVY